MTWPRFIEFADSCRFFLSSFHSGMVISIFLAVDWCHVRGILIEIRPSDSKLVPVRVDPFPERFSSGQSLRPCGPIHADEICRESVAIAPPQATAMIGSVIGRLKTGCNRLAIIIAEGAGDAGRQTCLI